MEITFPGKLLFFIADSGKSSLLWGGKTNTGESYSNHHLGYKHHHY